MKTLNLFELASFYNDVNYCFYHYTVTFYPHWPQAFQPHLDTCAISKLQLRQMSTRG